MVGHGSINRLVILCYLVFPSLNNDLSEMTLTQGQLGSHAGGAGWIVSLKLLELSNTTGRINRGALPNPWSYAFLRYARQPKKKEYNAAIARIFCRYQRTGSWTYDQ